MTTYTLPRTGDRALRFNGANLAAIDSKGSSGPASNRWYRLELYQLIPPQPLYAVAIGYRTLWEGETPRDEVHLCDTAGEVAEVLRSTVVGMHMTGFPPGTDEKRAHVASVLQGHYDQAVSELLACLPPEEVTPATLVVLGFIRHHNAVIPHAPITISGWG